MKSKITSLLLAMSVALAAMVLLPRVVHSAPGDGTYRFVDVKSVAVRGTRLTIRGIQLDATEESTISGVINSSSGTDLANCRQMALLAMSKPGKYLFLLSEVPAAGTTVECALERRE